jgi:hypothetical protein
MSYKVIIYDSMLSVNLRTVKYLKTEILSLFCPYAATDSCGRSNQTIVPNNLKR